MGVQYRTNLASASLAEYAKQHAATLKEVESSACFGSALGWMDMARWNTPAVYEPIEALADEIRQNADYFIVVGLGGSNQGARAVIEGLQYGPANAKAPKVLYAALNLSAGYLQSILDTVGDGSVYINVIAKNFQTLEPGVTFRILRDYMEKRYPGGEAAKRIITTVSLGDGELHRISQENGYRFLEFPADVGGRYSVFTPVGLLPIAVPGYNIRAFLQGGQDMAGALGTESPQRAMAREYALQRNWNLQHGFTTEVLAYFEPCLDAMARWWRQLFGESEGKNHTGIFPAVCSYTEDLHSIGQYMQQGTRNLMETFLHVQQPPADMQIPDSRFEDGYAFLDGKTLSYLNECAYEGTLQAHQDGGVPCSVFELERLDEYTFGQLMYFFMKSCFYSARILGVDPFDQPGVENYKARMNQLLGR